MFQTACFVLFLQLIQTGIFDAFHYTGRLNVFRRPALFGLHHHHGLALGREQARGGLHLRGIYALQAAAQFGGCHSSPSFFLVASSSAMSLSSSA